MRDFITWSTATAFLLTATGCVNTWGTTGDATDYYYQRAKVANYEAFPGVYTGGAASRYGRYSPRYRY